MTTQTTPKAQTSRSRQTKDTQGQTAAPAAQVPAPAEPAAAQRRAKAAAPSPAVPPASPRTEDQAQSADARPAAAAVPSPATPAPGAPTPVTPAPAASALANPATARAPAPKLTKLEQLRGLVAAPGGATLARLSEAVGWQRHTVRAALTRLRQAGHKVERFTSADGWSVYQLASAGSRGEAAVTGAGGTNPRAAATNAAPDKRRRAPLGLFKSVRGASPSAAEAPAPDQAGGAIPTSTDGGDA